MSQTRLGGLFISWGWEAVDGDEKIEKAYTIMKLETIAHVID